MTRETSGTEAKPSCPKSLDEFAKKRSFFSVTIKNYGLYEGRI